MTFGHQSKKVFKYLFDDYMPLEST